MRKGGRIPLEHFQHDWTVVAGPRCLCGARSAVAIPGFGGPWMGRRVGSGLAMTGKVSRHPEGALAGPCLASSLE